MSHVDRKYESDERGQIAIIAIIVVSLMLVTVVFAISFVAVTDYKTANVSTDSVQAYFLAESGMEEALIRLKRDMLYSGGAYTSDIGTYEISVDKSGNDYTVRSEGSFGDVTRVITTSLSIDIQTEEVTKYVAFGSDDVWMYWSDSIIYGDLWANDDINFTDDSRVYGNVTSAGRGSFFTSWVNWGAEVLDNPNTPGVVEGNMWSVNSIKVWGGHIHGDANSEHGVYTLFGGQIDGDRNSYQDLSAETERIDVPLFDFATYEEEAQNDGTYFSTAVQFEGYVNGLEDGNTRTIPDGVYYIENGNIKFEPGSKIVLNGTIVTEGEITFYCGVEMNSQGDLPVIVAQKDISFYDYGWPHYGGDIVTINGVIYSEKDINLDHDNNSGTISITGATWAGDDLRVRKDTTLVYDPAVADTNGFGFLSSTDNIQLHEWQETL